MPEEISPWDRFRRIRDSILVLPHRNLTQTELVGLSADLTCIQDQYQHDLEKLDGLRNDLKKLGAPPLLHALLIGPTRNRDGRQVVAVGAQRFDVDLALPEGHETSELLEGVEVLLAQETHAIVGVVGLGRRGESAEVREVLRDPETGQADRLLVRWGSGDGIVVDMATRLRQMPEDATTAEQRRPRAGDVVLVDSGARIAFEKLPVHDTGELELERDPDAHYEDIAGLEDKIQVIKDSIEMPYLYRGLFDDYGLERPRGILLHGPPGCGKTMIGKAVANGLKESIARRIDELLGAVREYESLPLEGSAQRRPELEASLKDFSVDLGPHTLMQLEAKKGQVRSYFLNIKGPELLSKWVGEAEHRIRQVFAEARQKASYTTPVVVFFDEIESMFQRRGTGISSDLEKTTVPQLLAELDGVEKLENVVVIGASNRAELLDPALLRPGRMDVKIKIDRPDRGGATAIFFKHLDVRRGPDGRQTNGVPLSPAGLIQSSWAAFKHEAGAVIGRLRESKGAYLLVGGELVPLREALMESLIPAVTDHLVESAGARGPSDVDGRRLSYGEVSEAVEQVCSKSAGSSREQRASGDGAARLVLGLDAAHRTVAGGKLPVRPLDGRASETNVLEHLAGLVIEVAVDALFSPHSYLRSRVTAPCGRVQNFPLREFVSGALIANVVTRAKRQALKRQLKDGSRGITADDLLEAISQEYEENREQFVASKPEVADTVCETCRRRHSSAEEYEVQVVLGRTSRDPWHLVRRPPRERSQTEGAAA